MSCRVWRIVLVLAALGVSGITLTGCGRGADRSASPASPGPRPPGAPARARVGARHAAAPAPDVGSMRQTEARPPAGGPAFEARMAALWRAIATGRAGPARVAFFPPGAYLQVKEIADARSDYANRLLAEYRLDLAAAHRLVGGHGDLTRLLGVEVPERLAHWVGPGTCANRVGYWEVPGARIVYRKGRATRSLGIASLISWRGQWYVVHLGAVTRPGSGGVVDDPEVGTGGSAPSPTC